MIALPESYERSREAFRARLETVRDRWPGARLLSHPLPDGDEVTIDWIAAEALEKKERVLIFTTGEHGVEGYAGAAALQLFLDEFLVRLDPRTTGLLLVHAINPWGMKHRRRVNAANVDLNRSFVTDFAPLASANPDYDLLSGLLNPARPLGWAEGARLLFVARVVATLARYGMVRLREATLRGQFSHPRGIYFGGQAPQEETTLMMGLFDEAIRGYAQMLTLDMHTGYGPRDQMTLVASAQEKRSSQEMQARFGVPRVSAANPQEFYSIQGDMIEYLYSLMAQKFPDRPFFAASFEFGTFGDSTLAVLRSLFAMVAENQVHWQGGSAAARHWVGCEFVEMFAPSAPDWLAKAEMDARQAFDGILRAEGFIE